jgi:2-polyprenyl-3-methyl-5-hydroxy-6-metoxy-1,4-benzoquinol methylase
MDDDDLTSRYFVDLAASFVRGKLGASSPAEPAVAAFRRGIDFGLRLHKFKRNAELPRVRRVLGILRGLGPESLLDVGSGRGAFLWPMLDAMPSVPVTAIDVDARRATDLAAVRAGGVTRLTVHAMSVEALGFEDDAFDVVTALEVLEHLADASKAAREAVRVARRCVVASVPSKEDNNPEHLQLFDPKSLEALFLAAGARRVAVEHVLNHMIAVVHR